MLKGADSRVKRKSAVVLSELHSSIALGDVGKSRYAFHVTYNQPVLQSSSHT
jgi:hypothetical protein